MRDDEEDRNRQKIAELNNYLDQPENIKVKIGIKSLNREYNFYFIRSRSSLSASSVNNR